jgi:hypothetical protein
MAFRFGAAIQVVTIGFTLLATSTGGPALAEDWP